MITIKVKTIWQGKVGVHEKYIKRAKDNKEDLEFTKDNETMVIPFTEIDKNIVGKSDRPFVDKYSNEIYYLYYFKWSANKKILTLF